MKINKKKKYKSLLKQKFVWKIRHPYHGMLMIPKALEDAVREVWFEKQKEIFSIQVHTIGELAYWIPKRIE
jgi:hypothetical protein